MSTADCVALHQFCAGKMLKKNEQRAEKTLKHVSYYLECQCLLPQHKGGINNNKEILLTEKQY